MIKQEHILLFNSLYPNFFESEGIRSLPEGLMFEEMSLPLSGFCAEKYKTALPDKISFGFFEGGIDEIRKAVSQVDEDWTQFFDKDSRIFCGYAQGQIASFCLVDDMGVHSISGRELKIGGPGCVGTVPEYRKKGIGLEMVRRVTQILKEDGFDYSYIHYTAVARWYAKLGYETALKWSKNGIE